MPRCSGSILTTKVTRKKKKKEVSTVLRIIGDGKVSGMRIYRFNLRVQPLQFCVRSIRARVDGLEQPLIVC